MLNSLVTKARKEYSNRSLGDFLLSGIRFTAIRPLRILKNEYILPCLPINSVLNRWYVQCNYQTQVGTFQLYVPRNSYYSQRSPKVYEPQTVEAISDHLGKDDVFYDIGAFFGYYVEVSRAIGVKSSNIHAFEADSFRASILRQNCGAEGLNIDQRYVSDTDSNQTTTLDAYVESNPPPDVIKMDIEGEEMRALRGAKDILSSYGPTLIVEVHPFGDYDEHNLIELLLDQEYQVGITEHQILRADNDAPIEWLSDDGSGHAAQRLVGESDDPYMVLAVR